MNIYTYYEPVGTDEERWLTEQLLELWENNWSSKGWRPVILERKDAMRHPRYAELEKRFMSYPTTNKKTYEMACFMRWVAMSVVGNGGYHCDFDVMNIRFRGGHCDGLTLYSKYIVPAMVWGTKKDYERLVAHLARFNPEGLLHVSDQNILAVNDGSFQFEKRYMMPEFMQEGNWYNYELVHFPNSVMSHWNMQPRNKYIAMLLDLITNLKR